MPASSSGSGVAVAVVVAVASPVPNAATMESGAKAGLQHYFVEQEGPFARMSPVEAAKVDCDYLRSIGMA